MGSRVKMEIRQNAFSLGSTDTRDAAVRVFGCIASSRIFRFRVFGSSAYLRIG